MARTTESTVRDVYGASSAGTALSTSAVTFWIDAANDFVTDHLGDEGLGADLLERIETLVACHLIASGDPTESRFEAGDTGGTFERPDNVGTGLSETRFGRRAITLDPTETLATLPTGDVSKAEFYGV